MNHLQHLKLLMLKGFLILVLIASTIGLITIQFNKPQTPPNSMIENQEDTSINTEELVFYKLVRPGDVADKAKVDHDQATQNKPTCTTDLNCETTLRIASFDLVIGEPKRDEQPKSKSDNGIQNTLKSNLTNSDNIVEIVNKQETKDEILDLIDNLADLQQKIEEK